MPEKLCAITAEYAKQYDELMRMIAQNRIKVVTVSGPRMVYDPKTDTFSVRGDEEVVMEMSQGTYDKIFPATA